MIPPLAFVAFGITALAQAPAQAADPARAVLDELAKQRTGITTLKATFELVNQSGADVTEDTGDLVFRGPDRLLFALDAPEGEGYDTVYLLDGERFYQHDLVTEQIDIYDYDGGSRMGFLMTVFRHDLSRLTEHFDVTVFDPGDYEDEAALGLLLEPKPGDDEPPFQRARLYLRKEDSLPAMVYVLHNSESEMFIRFLGYAKNERLAPHAAQIAAPRGTVIVENEQTFSTVEAEVRYLPKDEARTDAPAE